MRVVSLSMPDQLTESFNQMGSPGSSASCRSIPCNSPLNFRSHFQIGGVQLELRGASFRDVCGGIEMDHFQLEEAPADISVSIRWQDFLEPQVSRPAFDSGATWRL